MSFFLYALVMSCFFTATDLTHKFSAGRWLAPHDYMPSASIIIFSLTLPAVIGFWAFPMYAFFKMPWWQPIVGFIVAGVVAGLSRLFLGNSLWVNLWAIGLSLFGTSFAVYAIAFH